MAAVRDILALKGNAIVSTTPATSVHEAAVLMDQKKIGALIVLDDGRLVGVLSERDILRRIVAERRDCVSTQVGEIMTTEVVCCQLHTSLEEASGVMKNRRVRHLPVVSEAGDLQGMISIGDLNAHQTHAQEATIHLLHEYIYGRV